MSVAVNDGIDPKRLYSKVMWRIIPLIMVCYIFAQIDRANVGFAKLQFSAELGFSEAVYGLGAGLFYLGYSVFEVPCNLWLAKVGVRATIMRIMVTWSVISVLFAFMQTPTHFYVLRFLLGATEAGFFPGILLYLTTWIPSARRARFTALFMASIPIAGSIGGPLAGVIMSGMDGWLGMRGWQWLFIVEGAPAGLMGIATYFLLANTPDEARWLNDSERRFIKNELAAEDAAKRGHSHSSFLAALGDARFWSLALLSMGMIGGGAAVKLWLPTVIAANGVVDVMRVGLYSSVPFVIAIFIQQTVAWHSDRVQERRWHAAIAAGVAAVGWLALTQVQDNLWLALAMLTLAAAGYLSATGPFWTLPGTFLSGTAAAGGIAAITTVGGVGSFVMPTIAGWLADRYGNVGAGFYVYAVVLAGGAALMVYGTRPRARDRVQ